MTQVATKTLAAALARAQAVMAGAKKDAKNPHLRNNYADLASCWDACRKPLTDNGLSIVQTHETVDGQLYIATRLMHESGESLTGMTPVIYGDAKGLNPMQAMGSATTYARRYGLCAMVGIAPEDDDGTGAGDGSRQAHRHEPPPAAPPPPKRPVADIVAAIRDCPSVQQLRALYGEAKHACDGDQELWLDVQTMLTDRSEELKKATV